MASLPPFWDTQSHREVARMTTRVHHGCGNNKIIKIKILFVATSYRSHITKLQSFLQKYLQLCTIYYLQRIYT